LDSLKSPLLIILCVFCIAIVVGILLCSRYTVKGEYYYVQFGFIKSKYSIKEITAVVLDTDTKKLTVYVWENFSVLTMEAEDAWKFVETLQAVKPSITYNVTLTTPPPPRMEGFKTSLIGAIDVSIALCIIPLVFLLPLCGQVGAVLGLIFLASIILLVLNASILGIRSIKKSIKQKKAGSPLPIATLVLGIVSCALSLLAIILTPIFFIPALLILL